MNHRFTEFTLKALRFPVEIHLRNNKLATGTLY